MATNYNFKVYSPAKTTTKHPTINLSKLKSYQELLEEENERKKKEQEVAQYIDNLRKYQEYLEQEEKYQEQLAEQERQEQARKGASDGERLGETGKDVGGHIYGGAKSALGNISAPFERAGGWISDQFRNLRTGLITGNWYTPNIERTNTFDAEQRQKRQEEMMQLQKWLQEQDLSYVKDLSPKGQEIAYGVMSGIGEMLPSIAATVASGGVAGPGLIMTGMKAYGGASEKAFAEGATTGEAVAYGAMNAAVELLTEKLVGGATGKFTGAGKGILDNAIGKIAKNKAVQILIDIAGEGVEEAISEFLEPIMRSVYDDKAMESFLTKEHGEDILTSAIIGSLTSMVFEGANIAINGRYSTYNNLAQEYDKVVKMEQELKTSNQLTPELEQQINKTKRELEAKMELKLGKKDPSKQLEILSKIGDTELTKGYNPYDATTEITKTKPLEQVKTKQETKVEFTEEQRQKEIDRVNKLHETFKKVNPDIGDLVFDTNLGNNINGYYDKKTNRIHINPNVENAYTKVLTHELTHSLEGTDTYNNLQKYTLDYLRRTNEYDSIRNELEPLYKTKGLLDGMNQTEIDTYMNQEIMSKFSERLFTNQESINQLVNENRSLARKILNWVREKLGLLTGKLTKEEIELRKDLRKIEELYKKALSEHKPKKEPTNFRDNYSKKIKNKKKFSLNDSEIDKVFAENNVRGFEKKTIIDKIYEDGLDKLRDGETEYSNKIVVFDNEIDYTLEAIDIYDEDGEYDTTDYKLTINSFKKYDIEKLLKDNNIKFESSNQSESIYFTLNGEEYRVSTHKRPAVVDGFATYEHSYENEIIAKDEIDMYKKVEQLLNQNKKFSLSKDSAFKQTTINATESYFNQEALDMLKTDSLTYEVSTNKETVELARKELKGKKLETQIEKTLLDLQRVFKATKDNEVLVAKATLLMQEANKQGLNAQVNDLATTVSATLTQMGKATQAASIIQKLSPEGKLIAFRKAVEKQNNAIESKNPNYQKKKGFKQVVSERVSKWFNQDLNLIKKQSTLNFINNNKDVVSLTKEQISRLNNLTTTSENYTNNVVKVFEDALPNNLELAKQLGETYANGVLEQEKSLKDRYENSAVIIPEVLANQLVNAKSEASEKEVIKAIEKVIASQKSASFFDKMMQWRYLAMLGNFKTHFKNEVGNRVMSGVVNYRNFISRTIQTVFIKDPAKRTRTFKKADATVRLYAREQAKVIIKEMEDTSKYIEAKQQKVFDSKWLEAARKFNYFMLEFRDDAFKQARFEKELSEWMTAKGITAEQAKANPDLVKDGISYAWQQSLKATFQDVNKLATLLNTIESKNQLLKLVTSTILPFKKTPINIAKRGFEYSPAGLVKNLTYDIAQLNKGNITINQYLDKLSEGFAGTTIAILGMVLAKLGILSGGDDNKKLSNYEKAIGNQEYAIRIGDKTYTLDWLTPASIPLFTGVTLYEQINKETSDDGVFWSTVGALSASFDPMTDMSFLQSFNRILSSYDDNEIEGFVWASLESFAGQFIPTVSNQIARIVDPVRRSTTTTGKSGYGKKFNRSINYMISRIPILSKQLQPYINVWGEEEVNADLIDRLMENTAYPFWINKNKPSKVDDEILRLYTKYGNTDILPSIPNSYYTVNGERIDMTEEEYTEFKIKVGTFSKQQLEEIFNSQVYKNMTDENKEKAIKKVYSLAREYAKSDLSKEYLVYTALKDNKNKYSRYITEINNIEGLKDDLGNTIPNSKKNMVITYIQAQKNLSKEQKYLLFALAGYKNTNDKESVIKYVNSLDLTDEQKTILLQLYNY
jgi:hypothetical protein